MARTFALDLRDDVGGLDAGVVEQVSDVSDALLERLLDGGRVEDVVLDVLPTTAARRLHDAHRLLELSAPAEQLAVQGHVLGEVLDEPAGRDELVSEATVEGLSVPIRSNAVQLLADPPT